MVGTLFRRVCRRVILRGGFFANSIKWTFSVDSPVENAIFVALNVTLYMRIPSSLAAFAVCILMAFSHAFPMRAGERALQTPSQPADSALTAYYKLCKAHRADAADSRTKYKHTFSF